jgi:hypothetical protein
MAKETKVAGATPANTAVAGYDWEQSGITGFENVSQQDLGIPFLMILQKGSPQIDEAHPDHISKKIEGAKVGDIINTVKNIVVWSRSSTTALQFIPCSFEKQFVEWKPRESGGGIVKMHSSANIITECKRNEKGQDQLKNGNIVVTTAYFYGLVMIDGEYEPALIGLSSTQLKKAKLWLNMMQALKVDGKQGRYTPPMFSHAYALTTAPETNEKGNWYGWVIRMHGQVKDSGIAQLAVETAKEKSSARAALPAPVDHGPIPFA